jgi:hypothetical protein
MQLVLLRKVLAVSKSLVAAMTNMHIAGLLLLLAIQRMPRVFRGLKYL